MMPRPLLRAAVPARLGIPLLMALSLSGCLDLNFDPPSIVQTPRVLAMSASPPEALLGEDVRFEALIVDANGDDISTQPGVEVRWTICLSLDSVLDSANVAGGTGMADPCEAGGPGLIVLEPDGAPNTAVLPAEVLMGVVASFPMPDPTMPQPDPMIPGLDPDIIATLTRVIAEVGIPLEVTMTVRRDGELIMAGFKRFAITTRSGAGTNPPPPRFAIGDVEVSARGNDDPHLCVTEDGSPPVVDAETVVTLAPDENELPWLETYPVFDLRNEIIENEETAFYSWFSTGGAFSTEVTQRPERDTDWTSPLEPGTYPLWVVVRDGHLGLSWCRADVEVR